MGAGEIVSVALMLCATGALIAWFDWVLEGLPDALDYRAGKFSDRLETPWGDVVNLPSELRPARNSGGGGVHNGGRAVTGGEIAPHHETGL